MDKYQILGVIGQGQYGVAHKVQSTVDNKLYCMKRIPMSKSDDAKGAMKEAHLLATLNHPNVLGYRESFLHDGALCIITHFCAEGDLFTHIRKRQKANKTFTEAQVVDMFMQIAMGLGHIHSKRILHRDLKTQNIFVDKGGVLKLGDFGISKVLEKTDEFATTVTGTPYYMAPEICKNEPYSLKSDIWSLGCVLYELCTLKHAFAADSLLSLVYQIVKGNFPPIPREQFSEDLSRLVQALLHTDAKRRPTLQQVFEMPYVKKHKEQFLRRQHKLLNASRRRDERPVAIPAPLQAPMHHHLDDERSMTPKEAMQRRKLQQADQRQMELRLAQMTTGQRAAEEARMRKEQMLQGNTKGAAVRPVSARVKPPPPPQHPEMTYGGDSVLMGSVVPDAMSTGVGGAGSAAYDMLTTDDVNLGTVNLGTNMTGMSHMTRGGDHGGYQDMYADTGASVLMGSVGFQEQTASSSSGSQQPPPSRGSARPGSAGSNFQFGIDMSAPSTPLHFSPSASPGSPSGSLDDVVAMSSRERMRSQSGRSRLGERTASAATLAAAQALPPMQRPSTQQQAYAGPVEVNGFRFGVDNSNPSTPASGQRNAPRTPQAAPHQSPPLARAISQPEQRRTNSAPVPNQQPRRDLVLSSDEDSVEDELSEGYSDDSFEDYSDDDFESDEEDPPGRGSTPEPGTPKVQHERQAMMRNLRKMDYAGMPSTASQLEETVPSQVRNTKMDQIRARCMDALGAEFDEVYKYLRHVRQSYGYGDDEKLKNSLIEMVGRRKLDACFLCDQLVFQEMLQSD